MYAIYFRCRYLLFISYDSYFLLPHCSLRYEPVAVTKEYAKAKHHTNWQKVNKG